LSFYCPVCNGFSRLAAICPDCGNPACDGGRLNDYLGPYAPYRPIDEISRTNGLPDLALHSCVHVMYCEECGRAYSVYVREIEV
jgi:hypothetical protein